jgi:hypothetical protein
MKHCEGGDGKQQANINLMTLFLYLDIKIEN